MDPDQKICLCFHVTRRKIVNFIRVERPRRPSQLSECFGAGTGCGWCRPFLERLLAAETDRPSHSTGQETSDLEIEAEEYARQRAKYIDDGRGTPPTDSTTA